MKWLVPIVAMVCITSLMCYAIYSKIDGLLLVAAVGIIAALGGFKAPHKK